MQTSKDLGPPFAVIGTEISFVPQTVVIEMLQKNAMIAGRENIKASALFKKILEDFRTFAKKAEPGCVFQAPEARLVIIRLNRLVPIFPSLSEEPERVAQAAADEQSSDLKLIV